MDIIIWFEIAPTEEYGYSDILIEDSLTLLLGFSVGMDDSIIKIKEETK